MSRTHDARDHVVAVTGGARGIGLATATAFLAAGAKVAIGDLDARLAKEVAAGLGIHGYGVDVADPDSFEAFLDSVERDLGPLDVLVNNAGIMPLGPLTDEPHEITRKLMDVNLLGTTWGTKLAMRRMIPRGHGHIINVASAVGRVAVRNAASYSASKHGVVGLTAAVREELRGTGVSASVVLPTVTRTELVSGVRTTRNSRQIEPGQVADVIVSVVRRPRFETWVPVSNQRSYRVVSMLPRVVMEALMRATGALDGLADVDKGARSAYEDRVRTSD